MPAGRHKSRSLRRVFKRTPKGESKLVYKIRKPQKAHCGCCGKVLTGVAREKPSKLKNLPKTKKKPTRPFGGVLCSSCTRKLIISKNRSE